MKRKKYGNTKGKTVIDTLTGETFKSAKLAALAIKLDYGKLRDRLNGRVTNKTTLIYKLNLH